MAIKLLLADDHTIFRSGLKALLERESDLEVVAEAANGFDALRAVERHSIDVVVLDLGLPGLPGARVAETLLSEDPHTAIVVLTMHDDEYYLRELFRLGARGYLLKKSSGEELVRAIRKAFRGENYVDPALGGKVISSDLAARSAGKPRGEVERLTPREEEVCTLLAYGYTNAEIAEKLSISDRTVETHRNNLTSKLGAKSRAEIVRFAIERGLLKLEG